MFHRSTTRAHVALGVLVALTCAFVGTWTLHRASALHDTDAYYHLAIARLYAEQGIVDSLPQLRLSALRDGFGDKELGFHLLLAPLTQLMSPLDAGRLGLALLSAGLAGVLAAVGMRAVGSWGVLLPFWLVFSSTEVAWRLVRLRPEILSLLLLLAAAEALRARRPVLLGVLGCVFALSYTAFHAFLGLIVLSCLVLAIGEDRRGVRREVISATAALVGVGLGLRCHPHFPANLEIWAIQNIRFFQEKGALNVGTEIRPNTTDVLFMVNLGWIAGLIAIVLLSRQKEHGGPDLDHRRSARIYGVFALCFLVLYLLMSRFSLYAMPFTTLWVLFSLRARGRGWGAPAAGWRRIPVGLVAGLVVLLSLPEAVRQVRNYRHRTALGPQAERIADREAFSRALPEGARVVADWGPTATYLLWAPQGLYLNALDPVFMAAPFPAAWMTLKRILDGEEPDVPASSARDLDESRWLALPWNRNGVLRERLAGDPRVEVVYQGLHQLVRFRPSEDFVLDWMPIAVAGRRPAGDPPLPPGADSRSGLRSIRPEQPLAGALAGYVDAEALAPEAPCVGFARPAGEGSRVVELSPWGPTSVWVGSRHLLSVEGDLRALPGQPLRFDLEPEIADETVSLVTCEGRSPEHKGFYWRELPGPSASQSM